MTVEVDITPVIVKVGGLSFSGEDVLQATLDSPLCALNDCGSTPWATNAQFGRGAGGLHSQGDNGALLQPQDASKRAQFNLARPGSPYHLRLHANVLPAVTINVPQNLGTLLQSGRGVVFADIDIGWWSAQMNNLITKADATRLPPLLTDNMMLYSGKSPANCCVIGYHGTRAVGNGGGTTNSNGNAVVPTFARASWVPPGLYARPNGGVNWALQDIHTISHEIAEWDDDPFVTAHCARWRVRTDAIGLDVPGPLHADGRAESVRGLSPAGRRMPVTSA